MEKCNHLALLLRTKTSVARKSCSHRCGSRVPGYASDIRVLVISGKFSDAQREIYQIVLDAQEAAIEACGGCSLHGTSRCCSSRLAEGLIKLGVITQTIDDALDMDTGQLKQWYMHNTSHWIGLDVHDAGVYRPGGEPRTLEPGMCLTVGKIYLVHGGPMWIVQSATPTLEFELKTMSSSRTMGRDSHRGLPEDHWCDRSHRWSIPLVIWMDWRSILQRQSTWRSGQDAAILRLTEEEATTLQRCRSPH